MALRIGNNLSSLRAQRQLSSVGGEISQVFERLSSGQRINRAVDDAAGLSVASSLSVKQNVYTQGVRNGNDAISLLSIADSALESLSGIVTRIRELATQAASGTNSVSQRAALDSEAQALAQEYSRIAQSAKFNSNNLFDGSYGNGIRIQLGFGTDGSILSGLGGAIGTGEFSNNGSYNVGSVSASFAVGDLNGDGILDMVQNDSSSVGISVLLGNGDGTFTDGQNVLATSTAQVELADLNNDGILDIITDQGEALLGNGDGTFQSTISSYGDQNVVFDLADFNGDGILDLVLAENDDFQVNLGVGDGTFGTTSFISSVGVGNVITEVRAGDFNGDGIKDFAAAFDSASAGSIRIFLGDGAGSFSAAGTASLGEGANYFNVADFNNDGIDDLVIGDTDADNVKILFSDSSGNLSIPGGFLFIPIDNPTAFGIADFNGDGFLDFVAGGSAGSAAQLFLGDGAGSFEASTTYELEGEFSNGDLEVGDFNGDGVADFALRSGTSINIALSETEDGLAPLMAFSLETAADAKQAFGILDTQLSNINTQRGEIGAFQSRLSSAINTLQSGAENFKTAESRIRDADIATESANLVRLQILQNATTAVLAQANLQPSLVLTLLRVNN